MLEDLLKLIISEKRKQGISDIVILNFLKEYIQYPVLSLIYNHADFRNLVFKGGSCLRICYKLPRLSEDLDFDCKMGVCLNTLLPALEKYLKNEIKTKYFAQIETKIQSNSRIYLKFPFLYRLDMANKPESDKLYVKIEVENTVITHAGFEITPVSYYGFNFIARMYDLPTLMTGKIKAIISRLWFKGKKQEIDIKGRDFYDLYWFFSRGIKPNYKALDKIAGIGNEKKLKTILKERIEMSVTSSKLQYDLSHFLADQIFVDEFAKNYHTIMKKYL